MNATRHPLDFPGLCHHAWAGWVELPGTSASEVTGPPRPPLACRKTTNYSTTRRNYRKDTENRGFCFPICLLPAPGTVPCGPARSEGLHGRSSETARDFPYSFPSFVQSGRPKGSRVWRGPGPGRVCTGAWCHWWRGRELLRWQGMKTSPGHPKFRQPIPSSRRRPSRQGDQRSKGDQISYS